MFCASWVVGEGGPVCEVAIFHTFLLQAIWLQGNLKPDCLQETRMKEQ